MNKLKALKDCKYIYEKIDGVQYAFDFTDGTWNKIFDIRVPAGTAHMINLNALKNFAPDVTIRLEEF